MKEMMKDLGVDILYVYRIYWSRINSVFVKLLYFTLMFQTTANDGDWKTAKAYNEVLDVLLWYILEING